MAIGVLMNFYDRRRPLTFAAAAVKRIHAHRVIHPCNNV
jgi:hypothetical protein